MPKVSANKGDPVTKINPYARVQKEQAAELEKLTAQQMKDLDAFRRIQSVKQKALVKALDEFKRSQKAERDGMKTVLNTFLRAQSDVRKEAHPDPFELGKLLDEGGAKCPAVCGRLDESEKKLGKLNKETSYFVCHACDLEFCSVHHTDKQACDEDKGGCGHSFCADCVEDMDLGDIDRCDDCRFADDLRFMCNKCIPELVETKCTDNRYSLGQTKSLCDDCAGYHDYKCGCIHGDNDW